MAFSQRNREVVISAIKSRTPFQVGNPHWSPVGKYSFRGELDGKVYRIWSYDIEIANFNKEWWLNDKRYKVTTSRHMALVKEAIR